MIINMTGGAGGGLNFKVTQYTATPTGTAAENTIGVVTSTAISSWVMQAEQPSAATGKVWVEVATASDVPFYADKKQTVRLYPKAVKQYVDGGWKGMNAFIYQGGEWVAFSSSWLGQLYVEGNEYTDVTGGWSQHVCYAGSVNFNSANMVVSGKGTGGHYANAITNMAVDLSKVSTITVTATATESDANAVFGIGVAGTNSTSNFFSNRANGSFLASKTTMDINSGLSVDVSSISSGYVIVGARHGALTVTRIKAIFA